MARPPLHSLQGFVAAARHGNLTRAAESLHLTVSALSHQMRALEAHMGYPLLRRTARGVSPTADGQRLLDQVAPHLDAIARALHPYSARRDNGRRKSSTPRPSCFGPPAWSLSRAEF